MLNRRKEEGFTLIELLIVIAIIAIIAAVIFVALDPLTRFRDSRDARRWGDISALMTAIKVDQVDNRGSYLTALENATSSEWLMITDGTMPSGCADNDTYCDVNVTTSSNCIDLSGLVTEGYIGDVPVSPTASTTWDSGAAEGNEGTGYVLKKDPTGIITIQACDSENTDSIQVVR